MGTRTMKTFFSTTMLATAMTACASAPPPTALPDMSYATQWNVPVDQSADGTNPSLWATSPNALLSMRRAKEVGDLLTVVVEMDDQASLKSSLTRSRDSSENFGVDALFGLPEVVNRALPGAASVSPAIDYQRNSNLNGAGAVNRAEKIAFTLAARVVNTVSYEKIADAQLSYVNDGDTTGAGGRKLVPRMIDKVLPF